MSNNKFIAWAAPVIWMAVIFFLSHQPASISSSLSSGITATILGFISNILPGQDAQIGDFHTLVRKNAHFIAYMILAVLLVNAIKNLSFSNMQVLFLSFTIAVLFAVSDEFHQLFIEGRSGELRDVLIDSAGAATGIFCYWTVCSYIRKSQQFHCN